MSTKRGKNKTDLAAIINRSDLLEYVAIDIKKTDTTSQKKNELSKFAVEAQRYIDDQRQVLLIAVKLR